MSGQGGGGPVGIGGVVGELDGVGGRAKVARHARDQLRLPPAGQVQCVDEAAVIGCPGGHPAAPHEDRIGLGLGGGLDVNAFHAVDGGAVGDTAPVVAPGGEVLVLIGRIGQVGGGGIAPAGVQADDENILVAGPPTGEGDGTPAGCPGGFDVWPVGERDGRRAARGGLGGVGADNVNVEVFAVRVIALVGQPDAVGTPGRRALEALAIGQARDRTGIELHQVEFPVAIAVAAEGKAGAVGTPGGIAFVGERVGQAQRLAFAHAERPQVILAVFAQGIDEAAAHAQRVRDRGGGRIGRGEEGGRRQGAARFRPGSARARSERIVVVLGGLDDHDRQQHQQQQHGERAQRAILEQQRVRGDGGLEFGFGSALGHDVAATGCRGLDDRLGGFVGLLGGAAGTLQRAGCGLEQGHAQPGDSSP